MTDPTHRSTFAVCITRDAHGWQERLAAFAEHASTSGPVLAWSCGGYAIFVVSTQPGASLTSEQWQLVLAEEDEGSSADLTITVSRRAPEIRLQRGLLSTHTCYWWHDHDGDTFVCCDQLSQMARLVTPITLNQDAIPQHMLFRRTSRDMTYLQGVHRLPTGCTGQLRGSHWQLEQVETFNALRPFHLAADEESAIKSFEQNLMTAVHGRLTADAPHPHQKMLLSGGVDSMLIASVLQSCLPAQDQLNSLSYVMSVAEFAPEVEYARMASAELGTQHDFVRVEPVDYLRLLYRTTSLLGQPVSEEQMPCYTRLAESEQRPGQYLFSGEGGDNLLGLAESHRYVQVERYGRVPGMQFALATAGRVLADVWPTKAHGMREIAQMLRNTRQIDSLTHPAHAYGYTDDRLASMCFGPATIGRVIVDRLDHMQACVGNTTPRMKLIEFAHLFDLINDVHPSESALQELLGTRGLKLASPFFDGRVVSSTFALDPGRRYFAHGQYKWLPKLLLARRSHGAMTKLPKQHGGFRDTLFGWMKDGPLCDRVRAIQRPAFISALAFARKLESPDWFTWNLLTLDIFREWIEAQPSPTPNG